MTLLSQNKSLGKPLPNNMSRSLAFQFSSLCGISYDSGDIKFTPNNRALLSPVGHRLNRFGLTTGGSDSSCETYSFETLSPIRKVGVSKTFLLVIDTESRCLFCNQETGAILHRFNVKGDSPVRAVEFSIDEDFVALAVGRKVQVWKCPNSLNKVFSPMTFIMSLRFILMKFLVFLGQLRVF